MSYLDLYHRIKYISYRPLPDEFPACFPPDASPLLDLRADDTSDEDDMALALSRGLCPSLLVPDW